MRRSELLAIFVVALLLLRVNGAAVQYIMIPQVHAAMTTFPSDGDAWTENDNVTYPWTVSASYADDIEFQTDKQYVNNYALRVNHTSATGRMCFFLDLGSNKDVSSYWALTLYMRLESPSGLKKIWVTMADTLK